MTVVVYPEWHLPPWLSVLVAALLAGAMVGLLGWTLRLIFRYWRKARAADRQHDPSAPLEVGDRWVAGTVECDEGVPFAARVEIEQSGTEHSDGESTEHHWSERARRTFAQPFWIRHASGQRVRVEPAATTLLIDRLDRTVHDEPRRRFRIAELSAGERVVAEGKLDRVRAQPREGAGGYREAPPAQWVLRPNVLGRVELYAGSVGARYRAKARSLALRLLLAWFPAAMLLGASLSGFTARALFGQPAEAVITRKYVKVSTDGDGDETRSRWVNYETPTWRGHEQLDYGDWDELTVGARVAVVEVPGWLGASALGAAATLHAGVIPVGALLWALAFIWIGRARRPDWYEARLVESKSGRLPAPKPSTERVYSREDAIPPHGSSPLLPVE